MTWTNARPEGAEVARTDERYTVGQHETGYVLPRGLALEESPSTATAKKASDSSALNEVTGTPGTGEYRVLYDANQPLGGAWEFGDAGLEVLISYKDRGSLIWAHDMESSGADPSAMAMLL